MAKLKALTDPTMRTLSWGADVTVAILTAGGFFSAIKYAGAQTERVPVRFIACDAKGRPNGKSSIWRDGTQQASVNGTAETLAFLRAMPRADLVKALQARKLSVPIPTHRGRPSAQGGRDALSFLTAATVKTPRTPRAPRVVPTTTTATTDAS